MKIDVRRFNDQAQVIGAASESWLNLLAGGAGAASGSVALLGGRIAAPLFLAFAQLVQTRGVDLTNVHFFWSDERCVPPDHAESNFLIAQQNLFSILSTPKSHIHRIAGELPPQVAAHRAEAELRSVFTHMTPAGQPVLNLVLLGMGEDGHVASLFPEEGDAFVKDQAVYRNVTATKPPPERVTMGYPALAAAREVFLVVSGKAKEPALHASMRENATTPLGRLLRLRKRTVVFTDCAVLPD